MLLNLYLCKSGKTQFHVSISVTQFECLNIQRCVFVCLCMCLYKLLLTLRLTFGVFAASVNDRCVSDSVSSASVSIAIHSFILTLL